ncbi:hypothetical protein E2C01_042217 [Portunus trituberculatus]|uniref:Uncharacterized protein n=1 Tax=Portunus trituberculatus TaxID=210409 RepID=A0A5B7FU05_PORTR|nr:hypothetical protein [Portunus trituberculatus]
MLKPVHTYSPHIPNRSWGSIEQISDFILSNVASEVLHYAQSSPPGIMVRTCPLNAVSVEKVKKEKDNNPVLIRATPDHLLLANLSQKLLHLFTTSQIHQLLHLFMANLIHQHLYINNLSHQLLTPPTLIDQHQFCQIFQV